jgi:plasmid stability protein
MAQFTVRNLEEDVKTRLKRRAAQRGWSMEEEVRQILRNAVKDEAPPARLGSRIAARFATLGFSGDLPELRGQPVLPPEFSK